MEEPPEEDTGESLEPESTARFPNDSHRDRLKDNWKKLDKEEADNQFDHRTGNQANQRASSQTEPNIFGQVDYKVSEPNGHRTSQADLRASNHDNVADQRATAQTDQRMSEQTDSKASRQADHVESEQTDNEMPLLHQQRTPEHIDRRLPSQAERRTFEQMDRRMPGQADQRTSEWMGRRMPGQADQRTSEWTGRRMPGQADQRTSEWIGSRLSGLVERKPNEHTDHRVSDQTGYKTFVKTHHKVRDHMTELAEHQITGPADSSTRHSRFDKHDYSEPDEVDHSMNEEDDTIDDNQFDSGESDHQFDDRILTSKNKEADFRVQPSKFKISQAEVSGSKTVDVTGSGNADFLEVFNSFETKFINHLQSKGRGLSPKFPTISTQLDYIISEEKPHATATETDDVSDHQDRKSSHKKTHRKRFPSIVYQDPYQVSLQYMEKHHILQIFQITENLVYEKPKDPLSFMLYQVQEMIKSRDKHETYKE